MHVPAWRLRNSFVSSVLEFVSYLDVYGPVVLLLKGVEKRAISSEQIGLASGSGMVSFAAVSACFFPLVCIILYLVSVIPLLGHVPSIFSSHRWVCTTSDDVI